MFCSSELLPKACQCLREPRVTFGTARDAPGWVGCRERCLGAPHLSAVQVNWLFPPGNSRIPLGIAAQPQKEDKTEKLCSSLGHHQTSA